MLIKIVTSSGEGFSIRQELSVKHFSWHMNSELESMVHDL